MIFFCGYFYYKGMGKMYKIYKLLHRSLYIYYKIYLQYYKSYTYILFIRDLKSMPIETEPKIFIITLYKLHIFYLITKSM